MFLGGALAGVILGAAAITVFGGGEEAAPVRQVRFSIPRGETDRPRSSFSPDGSAILFTDGDRLWLRVIEEKEPREVQNSEGAIVSTWSPDGEWIAYSTPTDVYKSRPDGSNRTRLCQVETDMHPWAGSIGWMEDGRIVFTPGDQGILSVSSSGGDPTVFVAPAEGETDFHNLGVLPGNRGLLFHPHVDMAFDSIDVFDGNERKQVLRMEGQQLFGACYTAGHLVFGRQPDNAGVWAVPFSLESLEVHRSTLSGARGRELPQRIPGGKSCDGLRLQDASAGGTTRRVGNVAREIGTSLEGARDLSIAPDGSEAAVVIEDKDESLWIIDLELGERRASDLPGRVHQQSQLVELRGSGRLHRGDLDVWSPSEDCATGWHCEHRSFRAGSRPRVDQGRALPGALGLG